MHITKTSTFILFLIFTGGALFAQTDLWKEADFPELRIERPAISPETFRWVVLDAHQLDSLLRMADRQATRIELPHPAGGFHAFLITYSPVMEAGLADRFPQIRTYAGYGTDDPSATVRLDRTPQGFHALVTHTSSLQTYYIDPISSTSVAPFPTRYSCYFRLDHQGPPSLIEASWSEEFPELEHRSDLPAQGSFGDQQFVYRIAVSATGEYTQFHGGTVLEGLSAIVTTINRVNAVYQRDLGVRLVLVADNDQLVFTDPETDPFTPLNERNQNQQLLDQVLGTDGYDLGHVFGVGGTSNARGSFACLDGQKGRAYSGLIEPVGDPFDIDFVAHEIGHQLGAGHTFNKCGFVQGEQPYEPGSGTTIMGYAGVGLCFDEDHLSANSSDYFHNASISEIFVFTRNGDGEACAVIEPMDNQPPAVALPSGGPTIPKSTPFELGAPATDPDGDVLTWCWEEFDMGLPTLPDNPSGTAPLFRSLPPVTDSLRSFPRLDSLLANSPSHGEVLPDYARPLTFRLTMRDGRGGVAWATTQLQVTDQAGPFRVKAPNGGEVWQPGSVATVTWDVAKTDQSPVGATLVDILLSADGGYSYPMVLAAATPNDGAAPVVVPADLEGTSFRIKIKARGNVFFDLSDADFSIDAMTAAAPLPVSASALQLFPNPTNGVLTFHFQLTAPSSVTLVIYTLDGRPLKQYFWGRLPAGEWRRTIDLSGLPTGGYWYVFKGGPGGSGKFLKE